MLRAPTRTGPRNRLLAAFPPELYARVAPHLVRVELERRQVLYDYGATIDRIFFPETLVASEVRPMQDGSAVEAATIGAEGMVGLPAYFGVPTANAQTFVQVSGLTVVMPGAVFREVSDDPSMRALLGRYAVAFITQVTQSAACNGVHAIRQRCARWLLQTHDRVDGEDFGLTHDFLAQMLGVRRATVTEVASALQSDGLIEYRYGSVKVVDRAGLEQVACECYPIIRRAYAWLLEGESEPDPLAGVRMQEDGLSTLTAPQHSDRDRGT